MRLDDRSADRQSDAHAGLLGRKEGLKQAGHYVILGNPGRYLKPQLDHVVRRSSIGHGQFAARGVRHGVQRVAKQIDQHLLDLDPVDQHRIELRVKVKSSSTPCSRAPVNPSAAASSISLERLSTRFSDFARATRNREAGG